MNKLFKHSVWLLIAAFTFTACNKNDDDEQPQPQPQQETAKLGFEFKNTFSGSNALDFNGKTYLTTLGDSVQINKLTYFISNVELIDAQGQVWAEPESYHLIDVNSSKTQDTFTINGIPEGNYTQLRFSVGVDSARNHSLDLAVGDLKNAMGMDTWNWNTGYIFFKMEGKFFHKDNSAFQDMKYHIGNDALYRTVTLALPEELHLNAASATVADHPVVYVTAETESFFNSLDVQQHNVLHMGHPQVMAQLADNYASMFKINFVHQH